MMKDRRVSKKGLFVGEQIRLKEKMVEELTLDRGARRYDDA